MLGNISVHFILPLHTFGYINNFLYVRKDIERKYRGFNYT